MIYSKDQIQLSSTIGQGGNCVFCVELKMFKSLQESLDWCTRDISKLRLGKKSLQLKLEKVLF